MSTITDKNQLREQELKIAQLLWPRLSESPIKLDLDTLATEAGISKASLNVLLGGLTTKGVLKRPEGTRGKYFRGNPAVIVGRKGQANSRAIDLNNEATAPLTPPESSVGSEDTPSLDGKAPPPLIPSPPRSESTSTGVADIDQAIQRFEVMKTEIDRRLQVLYEARKVLAEPL